MNKKIIGDMTRCCVYIYIYIIYRWPRKIERKTAHRNQYCELCAGSLLVITRFCPVTDGENQIKSTMDENVFPVFPVSFPPSVLVPATRFPLSFSGRILMNWNSFGARLCTDASD